MHSRVAIFGCQSRVGYKIDCFTLKKHRGGLWGTFVRLDKSDFPRNYLEHIKSNIGKVDVILVSSHKEVRDALVENNIWFELVYPDPSIKEEFLQRYVDRGSPEKFISLLETNWNNWIGELEYQYGCKKIKLKEGQYLSDVI
jgi:hypothetical protein